MEKRGDQRPRNRKPVTEKNGEPSFTKPRTVEGTNYYC